MTNKELIKEIERLNKVNSELKTNYEILKHNYKQLMKYRRGY